MVLPSEGCGPNGCTQVGTVTSWEGPGGGAEAGRQAKGRAAGPSTAGWVAALLEQGEEPWIIAGDVRRCKKLDPRKAKAGGSYQPREQPHRSHRRRKGPAGMVFGSSL